MFDQTLFERILGETKTSVEISAYNADAAIYIRERDEALDEHWVFFADGSLQPGGNFTNVNFYDRALQYYAKYGASGYTDTTSRDRARAIVVLYIAQSPMNGGIVDWNFNAIYDSAQGVGLYYADTGSADALTWLSYASAQWRSDPWLKKIGSTSALIYGYDGRVTGRLLTCLITAYLCNAPKIDHPIWGAPTVPLITQANAIRQAMDQIVAGINGDGIWRYPVGSGGMAKPWMIGLIMEAMIYYNQAFEADSRIDPIIETACEYLYTGTSAQLESLTIAGTHLWYPPLKNFHYLEGPTPDEALLPAQFFPIRGNNDGTYGPPGVVTISLNGVLLNAYAYTYAKTGDTLWKTRADDILTGMIAVMDLSAGLGIHYLAFEGGKTLNENCSWSWKAFVHLLGEAASDPVMPWQIALRCR